ncbi:hypothetical protein [Streptomyces sp. MMG1121]|uniref:hypothetical protein n=1 Tax=Streptomyces sp. MMG1121 TaxID=1415544 RepID=UPI0006B01FCD|nr:hypothetical protein [Streptomyces sp. MMG1121]KOV56863.1 hypothetical protein ADK64_40880 [Streptomyces sp. MMG1121]
MGMKAKIALGAVVGIAVIGTVSANAGSNGKGGGSSASGKGSSASAEHQSGGKKGSGDGKAAARKVAFAGDGEFQVGSDVKPGTYRTSGNTDDMCYWERAKDAKGETDSLLANDNVSGTSYVTVKTTDKIFKSSGCKDWEAVDPKAKGTPASSMDGNGGMFKVGTDVAPGTYRSTGNKDDSCYWERTKDAEHGVDSIIANNNVTGTAVVTISPSDAYFKTTGCGAWKKAS